MTTRNRGRPRKNTTSMHLHFSTLLLAEIRTRYPTLLKPQSSDFRHGALSGWIENILWQHLRSTPTRVQSQIVGRSETGGHTSPGNDRAGLGRDIPRAKLSSGRAVSGGDESPSGLVGGTEGSDQPVKLQDWADYANPAGDESGNEGMK